MHLIRHLRAINPGPWHVCLLCVLYLLLPQLHASDGVPVTTAETRQQTIYRQVNITGTVTSPQVAALSLATSGLIASMHAAEGDAVQAGTLLLQLDSELAEYAVRASRAQVAQAEQAVSDAERRLREANKLTPQRSIAETAVRDLEAEVALDSASLEQMRAEAAGQQWLLERHRLLAPFSGVISRKLAEQGEWVTPGQGVFELVASDGLRLDFAVPEDYLAQLTTDSPVRFSLNALPGRRFDGRVATIVPVTDPGARTFLLRVEASDSQQVLMAGMSATATLLIPTREQGLVVPRDATLRYPDGRTVVWTVSSGDAGVTARENVVQIGETFDGLVEIRQGLQAGDRVVVRGNETLQNDQRVRIVNHQTLTSG